MLNSQALARLSRRHPEIMHRIRKVAETRREADAAALDETRPRKPRTRAARSSKQSETEKL